MEAPRGSAEELRKADPAVALALIAKCQENPWLAGWGPERLDNPLAGERPYRIAAFNDLESLRRFFAQGGWPRRTGAIYADLAFLQQKELGDEWWTLKRDGPAEDAGSWSAFESCSLGRVSSRPERFAALVGAMRDATAEECRRLKYAGRGHGPRRPLADRAREAEAAAGALGESAAPELGHCDKLSH